MTLVLGGTRSGKSAYAQRLAEHGGRPVIVVATGSPGDQEMADRIAAHRAARPPSWTVLEVPREVGAALRVILPGHGEGTVVLLDCLSSLVATCLLDSMAASQEGQAAAARRAVDAEVSELLGLAGAMSELIVVSSEVGLGVVPVSASGRLFRDLLGSAHQRVAEAAQRVYLLFAGLPLTLKPAAPLPSG